MTRLNLARTSLVLGLLIWLMNWEESVGHTSNADFLVLGYPFGATHAWNLVFREVCRDVAKMATTLLLFFGTCRWRIPITLILMLGYYEPFWIGEPFLPVSSALIPIDGWGHLAMAFFALLGLGLVRPSFLPSLRTNHDQLVR